MTPAIYVILLTFTTSFLVVYSNDERRLLNDLIGSYERAGTLGRPLLNSTDAVKVNISFGLIELEKFDIENQEVVMTGWTSLEWNDAMLRWDAAEYGGVEEVVVAPSTIWVPDIILSNSLTKPDVLHDTLAHVSHDGQVTWTTTYKYHFYCKISKEAMEGNTFPCILKFASWSMGIDLLDLKNKIDRFDADYYVPHRDWELFKNSAKREKVQFPWSSGRKTAEVNYRFQLKRRVQVNHEDDADSSSDAVRAIWYLIMPVSLAIMLHSRKL